MNIEGLHIKLSSENVIRGTQHIKAWLEYPRLRHALFKSSIVRKGLVWNLIKTAVFRSSSFIDLGLQSSILNMSQRWPIFCLEKNTQKAPYISDQCNYPNASNRNYSSTLKWRIQVFEKGTQQYRGVYSGKSGCLVLPKNLAFYGKPEKTVMYFDLKVAKTLWRSRASPK